MKLLRLSGRKVCERVKAKGFVWKGKHMQARYLKGKPHNVSVDAPEGLRVGLVTSAKLDKSAVKRNRMRRRCREALRITARPMESMPSTQLLVFPRSSSLSSPFGELEADAEALIRFLTTRA